MEAVRSPTPKAVQMNCIEATYPSNLCVSVPEKKCPEGYPEAIALRGPHSSAETLGSGEPQFNHCVSANKLQSPSAPQPRTIPACCEVHSAHPLPPHSKAGQLCCPVLPGKGVCHLISCLLLLCQSPPSLN